MDSINRTETVDFQVLEGVAQPKPAETGNIDKFDEILKKLEDPNTPIVEVSRLITIELGKIAKDAVRQGKDPGDAWKQKAWETQVKVLTALAKQCNDTDILSKKDALNFDGPRFKFVLTEICNLFKKTLEEAELDGTMVKNIMLQFADAMAMAEPSIRRESEKIDIRIK
jgi:seryl-tRNA synthetase